MGFDDLGPLHRIVTEFGPHPGKAARGGSKIPSRVEEFGLLLGAVGGSDLGYFENLGA